MIRTWKALHCMTIIHAINSQTLQQYILLFLYLLKNTVTAAAFFSRALMPAAFELQPTEILASVMCTRFKPTACRQAISLAQWKSRHHSIITHFKTLPAWYVLRIYAAPFDIRKHFTKKLLILHLALTTPISPKHNCSCIIFLSCAELLPAVLEQRRLQ